MIQKTPKPLNLVVGSVAIIVLLMAGGSNLCRWPAPYTVQCDKGSWGWVEKLRSKIGNRLVFFDYYPYSVPFAVTGETRALGLCEGAREGVAEIITWLKEKACKEQVLIATAYENPGIEDGVALNASFRESVEFMKVASKGSLPAEKRTQVVDIMFLQVIPVSGGNSMPVLNKIFDDGPLALRGSWGKGSPIKLDGRMLPARWSREGSGVIGPVPLPGQSVKISIEGAASRDDGVDGQALKVVPPWGGEGLTLSVSNDYCSVSGLLLRPLDKKDTGLRTGIYRLSADKPYDPAKAGIKGYENDLGARIHLIRIELISVGSNMTEKTY